LSAVLAWRAAKTRIHHRPVALLLLQFAAAGSLRERAPWLSTRPAPALDRSGPTRSPILIGNVLGGGTYQSGRENFLVGFGPGSTLNCSANVKIETACAVIDNAGVIRDSAL
jgi:hypothetical protein